VSDTVARGTVTRPGNRGEGEEGWIGSGGSTDSGSKIDRRRGSGTGQSEDETGGLRLSSRAKSS
jgi:hypothetical protein